MASLQSDSDNESIASLQLPQKKATITFKRLVIVKCKCGCKLLPFPFGNKHGLRNQVCYFKRDSNNNLYFMSVKIDSDSQNDKTWGNAQCTHCNKNIGEFHRGKSRFMFRFPEQNIDYKPSNQHQLPSNAAYV